jgi:hypothetical protein
MVKEKRTYKDRRLYLIKQFMLADEKFGSWLLPIKAVSVSSVVMIVA